MKRFPLFNVYRTGALSICTLIVLTSFVLGLAASAVADLEVPSIPARVGTFMYIYLIGIAIAFILMTVSEAIKIFLSMEDHLYSMRYSDSES